MLLSTDSDALETQMTASSVKKPGKFSLSNTPSFLSLTHTEAEIRQLTLDAGHYSHPVSINLCLGRTEIAFYIKNLEFSVMGRSNLVYMSDLMFYLTTMDTRIH